MMKPVRYGNSPFPSCLETHFQSRAKCKTFNMKMSFHSLANKTHFLIKGFALDLAMKQRQKATLGNGLLALTHPPMQVVKTSLVSTNGKFFAAFHKVTFPMVSAVKIKFPTLVVRLHLLQVRIEYNIHVLEVLLRGLDS